MIGESNWKSRKIVIFRFELDDYCVIEIIFDKQRIGWHDKSDISFCFPSQVHKFLAKVIYAEYDLQPLGL